MKFNWILLFLFTFAVSQFTIWPSSADDFWDLPSNQTAAQKVELGSESNDDIWALDSPDNRPSTMSDENFWSGNGNTSLDDFIQNREELRIAEEARVKAAEEAMRIVRLERQRQREAEEARRQAQIDARRRQEEQQKSNNGMFGKLVAIGMGAAIANNSSLNDAAKADFLTNYSTDVLNNDLSMSNTNQWKNNAVQTQGMKQSSGGVSEADKNRQISSLCKQKSNQYNDGDGQSTPQCQLAIYNQCVADKLCSLYPDKCDSLRSRVVTSCEILSKMGDNRCPVCR